MAVTIAENDLAWKYILVNHLKDFLEFFWVEAYQDIDWSKPYDLLEQELNKIALKDQIGKKNVDKLFKVFLKNGQEQWLLLHIEVQHFKEQDFAKRMFTYYYRIFNQYDRDVASMAVLADADQNWHPTQFHREIWQTSITRTFATAKIMDYQSRKEELKNSNNPFALIVLAQLAALETKPDQPQRLVTKIELIKYLLKHGWDHQKIHNLYTFLDFLLALNPDFEVEYLKQVKQLEEEHEMHITTTAERHGYNNGEIHILTKLLEKKFPGNVTEEYLSKLKNANSEVLEKFAGSILTASSIEDVFKEQ